MILLCDCFFKRGQRRRARKWKMEEKGRCLKEIMSRPMKGSDWLPWARKEAKRKERCA
jgi:hypothetical protein